MITVGKLRALLSGIDDNLPVLVSSGDNELFPALIERGTVNEEDCSYEGKIYTESSWSDGKEIQALIIRR